PSFIPTARIQVSRNTKASPGFTGAVIGGRPSGAFAGLTSRNLLRSKSSVFMRIALAVQCPRHQQLLRRRLLEREPGASVSLHRVWAKVEPSRQVSKESHGVTVQRCGARARV